MADDLSARLRKTAEFLTGLGFEAEGADVWDAVAALDAAPPPVSGHEAVVLKRDLEVVLTELESHVSGWAEAYYERNGRTPVLPQEQVDTFRRLKAASEFPLSPDSGADPEGDA